MKRILEKLLKIKSSKDLAYELIDRGAPYSEEEVDKLSDLIRKWKSTGHIPKKWQSMIKNLGDEYSILEFDAKDEKILKLLFITILKDIKITFYEDSRMDENKSLLFLILMIVLDEKFISDILEKEFKNFCFKGI